MWGHDFRPEYRQLKVLHERFPGRPADRAHRDRGRADARRHRRAPRAARRAARSSRASIVRTSATASCTKKAPLKQLLAFLAEHRGESGIIYRFSRKKRRGDRERRSRTSGYDAIPYHAGLDAATRRKHQDAVRPQEEGVIVVATIAFGMGIDKPDVRFVVHLDLPRSRRGLLPGDRTRRTRRSAVRRVADLRHVGHRLDAEHDRSGRTASEERKRVERQKLFELLGYCESIGCRRQSLLAHFGEAHPGDCGNCDNCLNPPTSAGTARSTHRRRCRASYRTGERFGVSHLIDVLLGRDTEKVLQHGHTALSSTFGIGTRARRAAVARRCSAS